MPKKLLLSALVALVIMVAGIFLSGYIHLNSKLKDVEQVYYNGVENDSLCVYNDIQERVKLAKKLQAMALNYVDSDNAEIVILNSIFERFDAHEGLQNDYHYNKELDLPVHSLLKTIYTQLSEKDKKEADVLRADFDSAAQRMSHDAYNEFALEYNNKLSSGIAPLVGGILGFEEAPIF